MTKNWLPEFKQTDCEVLSEKTVYGGYCAIKQYTMRFRLFKGGWSHAVTRDVLSRASKDAAAVLLYDPKLDKVVMIEQIRLGALQDGVSPWLLEIVAGVIDPQQTAESTARLEAKEEANCELLDLKHICNYYASPGISSEMTHVFCGFINIAETFKLPAEMTPENKQPKFLYGLKEDGEDIQCHIFSTDEVLKLLEQGKITSASAVIALQWLALNRTSLRSFQ